MGVKHLVESKAKIPEDEEIKKIVERAKTRIKVVGCGGAGNNTISRLMQIGIVGAETIAINTDAMDLLYTDANKKVLIGRETTQGLGAGADPSLGMAAAKENREDIKKALKGAHMVFLTAGLGGGCLRGESLVYNSKGRVRIDSIRPGALVYSLDGGRITKKKVLAAMKTGVKRVLEVKTKNRVLYASYDHPFLKLTKNCRIGLVWARAEGLAPGNHVVVLKRRGNGSQLFETLSFERIESIKEVGEEEVYDLTVEGTHNFIAEGFVVHNTGTGSMPIVASISKRMGALTVAIVTLPFKMEGKERMVNAEEGLKNLEQIVDTLIVVPNEKLLEIVPDVSLGAAFKIADEILSNAVKGITELVTKPGLVNLDFADLKAVMKESGLAMIGMGESDTENRAYEAVEKAINNPLLDVDITNAKSALIDIISGPGLTIKEAQQIVETVSSRLSEDAKVIWGAQIDKGLGDLVKTLLVVTGVQSPYIFSPEKTWSKQRKRDIEKILGVKFVE